MEFAKIASDSQRLEAFLGEIMQRHETFAPVEAFGRYSYRRVTDPAACRLQPPIGKTQSIKPLFSPQTGEVLRFRETRDGVQILPPSEDPLARKKVVLGVKMCDAQAMQILDKVARWDHIDEDFLRRRENTVIVAHACEKAEKHCFCGSLGFDWKSSQAFDVLVVPANGKGFVLQAMTAKGEALLREGSSLPETDIQKAGAQVRERLEGLAGSFHRRLEYDELHRSLKERFESPEFDEFAKLCISCKTCSFLCPTCHCFKTVDEKVKETGVRYKCYDACACQDFTLMAGGHNPRPEKRRRWRQRALHKFVYYQERFGTNLCVGCGRCVSFCPVNIDIFEVVTAVAAGGGKK